MACCQMPHIAQKEMVQMVPARLSSQQNTLEAPATNVYLRGLPIAKVQRKKSKEMMNRREVMLQRKKGH